MTEEVRKTRTQKRQEEAAANPKMVAVDAVSWGLRIVIVILLIVVAAIVGAMIGYGVIGSGNPFQVLNPTTWTHVFDIMNGKEE
ncbi:DNA-directed RNA polymerase subunit beta [Kurthia senegalensis]|uniref:DNA-directed RNA polymerase subunit beta n=1 Tax=Kurthia senegalensis TaxID=1033740 RepID=UPI00028A3723|nr:DNA-directed RNA polymerase subunit beta [Kurthia senegalensis]